MIQHIRNVRQLVWHLYVNTAVKGSELYCFNTEGDRSSEVSQASYGIICAAVNHEMSKFTHGVVGGIRRLPHRLERTLYALGITLKIYDYVLVRYF